MVQEDSTLRAVDDVANSRYQSYKTFEYSYDLVSGNVNMLAYQHGQADAFYYKYEYDADNRVTAAYTHAGPLVGRGTASSSGSGGSALGVASASPELWDRDSKYFYYQHGPLARTEIGQNKVQASDYAYTLHGWIKGVNSNLLTSAKDMGEDGKSGGLNKYIGVDQYGYQLTYYDTTGHKDYTSITTNPAFASQSGSSLASSSFNLWNGNIKNMVTSIAPFLVTGSGRPQARAFTYDQLNRIKIAQVDTAINTGTNAWGSSGNLNSWKESFIYDNNGNITTLVRHGKSSVSTVMDSLSYHYAANKNQLTYVDDAVSSGSYGTDIDDQSSGNYTYDKIGNLVSDVSEEIDSIIWNVYGKIERVVRTTASGKSDLEFHYDAMGYRVCKIVKPRTAGVGIQSQDNWTYTYYLRDASGNVIAVYDRDYTTPAGGIFKDRYSLKENHLYGSSRTGIRSVSEFQMAVTYNYSSTAANGILVGTFASRSSTAASTTSFNHEMGRKSYELSNHLGNVLVTVSDARTATNSSGTVVAFNAIVVSAQDYYAFGSEMVGRTVSGSYRYSFNGKEKDAETDLLDYGMRMYNDRLGRFLSVDPLIKRYPFYSPYQFAGNKPLWASDLVGCQEQTETGPQSAFDVILQHYREQFNTAWKDSHTDETGKGKVHEYSGVLIKVTRTDAQGNTIVTYEIHNYDKGDAGQSQSWRNSYSGIPANAEVLGNFHTHPYSEKDIKTMKRTEHPKFDGNGTPWSGGDLGSYTSAIPDKYFAPDQVFCVVAGTDLYGMTINDPEKAKKFMENAGVVNDFYSTDYPNVEGSYADIAWAKVLATQQAYEAEHGEGSSGVTFDRAPLGTGTTPETTPGENPGGGEQPPQGEEPAPQNPPPQDPAPQPK